MKEIIERDKKQLKELGDDLKCLEDNFKRYGDRLTELKAQVAVKEKAMENARQRGAIPNWQIAWKMTLS